ncbi:hypothetical protein CRUP_000015 [Coryphaenoides rupestris]|nr:hypothetical protein CRUP_000015 [Coryphaenoides rupestris]
MSVVAADQSPWKASLTHSGRRRAVQLITAVSVNPGLLRMHRATAASWGLRVPTCRRPLLLLCLLGSLASSNTLHRRAIRFEPAMLDFGEHPVGTPLMEKVRLHNPGAEDVSLMSISGSTSHFHASFFQHAILPPGGTTSFDVVFLPRMVVVPLETRASCLVSHAADNLTAFLRVRNQRPTQDQSPVLPVEPSSSSSSSSSGTDHPPPPSPSSSSSSSSGTDHPPPPPPPPPPLVQTPSSSSSSSSSSIVFFHDPGVYCSTKGLDFGTLRSQDGPDHRVQGAVSDVEQGGGRVQTQRVPHLVSVAFQSPAPWWSSRPQDLEPPGAPDMLEKNQNTTAPLIRIRNIEFPSHVHGCSPWKKTIEEEEEEEEEEEGCLYQEEEEEEEEEGGLYQRRRRRKRRRRGRRRRRVVCTRGGGGGGGGGFHREGRGLVLGGPLVSDPEESREVVCGVGHQTGGPGLQRDDHLHRDAMTSRSSSPLLQ